MRIPHATLPLLVVAALFGGFFLRDAFTQPSTQASMGAAGAATVECIVDGVKCKGTASLFTTHFEGVAGISTIETYAADHRVVITYDPAIITPDAIRRKIDSPVVLEDGTQIDYFKCVSMDAAETAPPPATQ